MLPNAAVLHGVIDPTFASNAAVAVVQPLGSQWTDEERRKIEAVRDTLRDRLATEVNRIEAQLSLMVSYAEGKAASDLAIQRAKRIYFPWAVGFVAGAASALLAVFLR